MRKTWFFLLLLLFTACTPAPDPGLGVSTSTPEPVHTLTETEPAALQEPAAPTRTPTPRKLYEDVQLCSPLEDITLEELPEIISNPFDMPYAGMDDGHHGVDFAFYRYHDEVGMAGHPINAVLPGRVAGVILDRPPYGNTIIIETDLDELPEDFLSQFSIPEPVPTVVPFPALNCPDLSELTFQNTDKRSIYLLYAHMIDPPELRIGDEVDCGETLGGVGTTGSSVNEHLHFEYRIGPAGAEFPVMAHYDNSSTTSERQNYCIWRVSGLYKLLDPMNLLLPSP